MHSHAHNTKMEAAKSIPDGEKLYRYEGTFYSSILCPAENLTALKTLEVRPDNLLLAAYPKCGFNWTMGMLHKIMPEASPPQMPPLLEYFSPDMQKALKEMPSPRFLGTHVHPDLFSASFIRSKTKMLVVFRNPKDTVVSFYHFMKTNPVLPTPTSWDAFFNDFMTGDVPWGSYFDHAVAWNRQMDNPDVMVVIYEEQKENLASGVKQIAEFFGFSLTEEQVQNIAGQSTFNAMKENAKNTHGQHANVFFRKGEVGDWKNHLTEEQSVQMDQAFQKHLAGTKLGDMLKSTRPPEGTDRQYLYLERIVCRGLGPA